MPFKFRYVPTSGDISGVSFESQTEQAINEIGQMTEEATEAADKAIDIASGAVATANAALSAAQNAEQLAQSAVDTAENALTVANGVEAKADAAQARADDAFDLATTANTAAASAQARADDASNLAATANTTATEASNQASQAITTAQGAMQVATNALGIFVTEEDNIDANTVDYWTMPGKFYCTGDALINFPTTAPLYFNIDTTEDNVSAIQTIWSAANPTSIFRRAITITITPGTGADDPIISAAFSAWAEYAANKSATTIGEIQLKPFRPADLITNCPGWYFCNGDRYPLASQQGQALNSLGDNYKADWGIAVSDDNITLPNLFDVSGNGYFFRPVDGTTRQVGSTQAHAVQDHAHNTPGWLHSAGAIFFGGSGGAMGISSGTLGISTGNIDEETRPINIGMTPAIYLGV